MPWWDQDRLYIAGAHGKDLQDSLTFFPLFNPGDPAWFDGSFNGLRDAFAASLCTTPLTSVPEEMHGDLLAAMAVPTGPDHWCIAGLPDGRYQFTLHDAAGRLVLSEKLVSQNGRTNDLGTMHSSPGFYTGLLSGPRAAYVRIAVVR